MISFMDKYPANPLNYGSRRGGKIDLIVIHTTQAPGAVNGTFAWFQDPKAQVSAHYVVTQAGLVYRCVPDEASAWHAGAYNRRSLGIEVEGDCFKPETWTPTVMGALITLTSDLCSKYDVNPIRDCPGILGHADLGEAGGNHKDPGPHLDWAALLTGVRAAMLAKVAPSGQTVS